MHTNLNTVILGQVVLDEVILKNTKEIPISEKPSVSNKILLGGPPSFSGTVAYTFAKAYQWIPIPILYSYICPRATAMVKKIESFSKISENLILRQRCPNFRLEYLENHERTLYMTNPPIQFSPQDFSWDFSVSPIAIIGSVFDEFNSPSIFKFLREQCSYVAFDPQGCFRRLNSKNEIEYIKWFNPDILSQINCLKVSEFESKLLDNGENSIETIYNLLEDFIDSILITRGNKGVIFGYKRLNGEVELLSVPAYTKGRILDETGAGDMFLYLYVIYLTFHQNEKEAISFATAATSLLLEQRRFCWEIDPEIIKSRQNEIMKEIIEF